MNHILSLIFSGFAWRSLAKALVFAVLALSISACDVLDDDDDDDDAETNSAPTSNAGADQSVVEGTAVTLDGSGSSDSDGEIESYAWTLTTTNDTVTLTGADTATASFTAPEVDSDTELVFRLTVTDDDGDAATDDVTITVTNNVAPTANAGVDKDANEGTSVSLDGTASSDSDGTIASYAWAQVGEENLVEITNASSATASFMAPYVASGTTLELEFTLTVTDNYGATNQANVKITVVNTTSADPVANAGEDQTVFEGEEVILSGTASDDGTIVKYEWTHAVSNPGVDLSGENTATASFTAPELGDDIIEEEMAFDFTVTDDDGATATDGVSVYVLVPEPSSQVLFASQYELTGNGAEPYAISEEDGEVYSFSGGDFYYTWGLGEDPNFMIQRQAYGLQFNHAGAIDGNSFFGLAFKAPGNSSVDISESDTLVIQTGNGAATDAFANSHMVFTIELNGGDNTCSYDLTLTDGSRPGPDQQAWTSPFGIHTYRIPFGEDYLNCADDLKADLQEVVVKVVGGKDATASSTENNQVLMQVGYIGFSNDTASVPGNGSSDYLLFASQYELIDGATDEPYTISDEDGFVYGFSGGDFNWAWSPNANEMIQRQAYGFQFYHTGAIDGNSYFGLAFKAPNNSSLDVSGTDVLVIQTGNGAATDAFPNSHMVYTIELNGNNGEDNDGTSSCSYDLALADGSRTGPDQQAWTSPFGIHTYYVDLSLFTCSGDGSMDFATSYLEEVVVKVVGGKDATASAAENNHVILQVGYIAFAADDDDE